MDDIGAIPLVSGFGADTGGGLFALVGGQVEQLDALSTTGVCLTDDGLARVLRSEPHESDVTELVQYDQVGLISYRRFDGVPDPHDVVWHDGAFLVVSSHANAIFRLEHDGTARVIWQGSPVPDSWHPNCLTVVDGELWLTAFGRFESTRGWSGDAGRGEGLLLNLDSGREFGGMAHPHSPRWVDGIWWVCSSYDHALVRLDPISGEIETSVALDGYTRGLAVDERYVYVGQSGRRDAGPEKEGRASVAVLRRDDLSLLTRIPLPVREVYDIVLAPPDVVDGVRRGDRVNPTRRNEQAHAEALRDAGERDADGQVISFTGLPLPAVWCRVAVEPERPFAPPREAGRTALATIAVTNLGRAALGSSGAFPVHLASKWRRHGHETFIDGERASLGALLRPGETSRVELPVTAPDEPGSYELVITAVQEAVAWFDDLDAASAWRFDIDVTGGDADGRALAPALL